MTDKSIYFQGNQNSYLTVPNTESLLFRQNSFTIEFWMYFEDANPYPRILQMGSYGMENITFGISIEGGTLIYWQNNSTYMATLIDPYINVWTHIAVTRLYDTIYLWANGYQLAIYNDGNADVNGSDDLVISNETIRSNETAFKGYLYGLHIMNGFAKYYGDYSNYTPEAATLTPYTILLLYSVPFLGSLGPTVLTSDISYVSFIPNIPSPIIPIERPINSPYNKKIPLFSTQDSGSRLLKLKQNTITRTESSFDKKYKTKDTKEHNTINHALRITRSQGSSVPAKITGQSKLF